MTRNPVDTGRKLNVHKTFRRGPGRLLNVLCTFNLRPVSTGKVKFVCSLMDGKTLLINYDLFKTCYQKVLSNDINSFHATGLFLYSLKISENQRFSNVFRGMEKDHWHEIE